MTGLAATVVVLFYAALTWSVIVELLRSKKELARLVDEKGKRKRRVASQGTHDVNKDILYLLSGEEKASLVKPAPPLAEWLGGRQISELSAAEAEYFAGLARNEMNWKRYEAQTAQTVGSVVIGGELFLTFSALVGDASPLGMARTGIPLILGLLLLLVGVKKRESSDAKEFYAKALEDQAHDQYRKAKLPNGTSQNTTDGC